MPKQGGQGKGKPKLADRNFGKALIRRQLQGSTKKTTNMVSILDSTTLDDYITHVEMEGTEVEVRRVNNNDSFLVDSSSNRNHLQSYTTKDFHFTHLTIPRKPSWSSSMTAEEVDRREKDSFLQWRRHVASQENANFGSLKVTPFEKNLEVWRQLWRVVERSDFLVQIVDARNPLLYYTSDLSTYSEEKKRRMMLLINKSDLLTDHQRIHWARYFRSVGIRCVFYSAKAEQTLLDSSTDSRPADEEEVKWLAEALTTDWNGNSTSNHVLCKVKDALMSKQNVAEESLSSDVVWGIPEEEGEEGEEEEEEESNEEDEEGEEERVTDNRNPWAELSVEEEEETSEERDVAIEEASGSNNQIESSEPQEVENQEESSEEASEEEEEASNEEVQNVSANAANTSANTSTPFTNITEEERSLAKVLNRQEIVLLLLAVTRRLHLEPQERHQGRVCVGMVGYPNVGKSSVINTILGVSKASHGVVRVAVSATPGKTKHFQTLVVSDSLMLCDCPGLVFPSFMRSTGEMLCAGILPFNQMRDYIEPAAVIAARVPMHLLDAAYGMKIQRLLDVMDDKDRPPTAHEMLSAYCAVKGYITNGTGRWDEFRACKDMLRDFTDGRILYVAPPPTMQQPTDSGAVVAGEEEDKKRTKREQQLAQWVQETEKVMLRSEKIADRVAVQKLKECWNEKDDHQSSSSQGGEMVFGGSKYPETEFVMDLSDSDDDSHHDNHHNDESVTAGSITSKREHKRLKHWGKKNKKLRDKTPYGEENGVISYVAYSTNRSGVVGGGNRGVLEKEKLKRQDPRHAYGHAFVRSSLPHQQPKELGASSVNSSLLAP